MPSVCVAGSCRRILAVLLIATAFALILSQRTSHPGEAVLLVMPFAMGAVLWLRWPRVRCFRKWPIIIYLVVVSLAVFMAELIAAWFVGGRVIPIEVFWAVYFIIAWRLSWAVWSRSIGRLGEGYRLRLVRRRRRGMRVAVAPIYLIPTARLVATACVFAPLLIGSLVHRIKIGNPLQLDDYRSLNIEPIAFETEDGLKLSGWFLGDVGATDTVIICHGAGANKANFIGFLTLFYGHGFNGLIFDFRGHGDSDGHTSSFGLYEDRDVRAAVDWLRRDRPDKCRRIVALGSSMGAMALARAAAGDPRIEAIVLDSCFVSASQFLMDHTGRLPLIGRPLTHLLLVGVSINLGRSIYEMDLSHDIMKIGPRPILFIHGDEDFLIRPSNMDLLFDLANPPREKWLGHGPHSNVLAVEYDEYQRRVVGFLNKSLGRTPRSGAGRLTALP